MNTSNKEKILQLLTQLVEDVSGFKEDVSNLKEDNIIYKRPPWYIRRKS